MISPADAPPTVAANKPPSPGSLVRRSIRLVRENPRDLLLPALVVQVPLAILSAAATAILFSTAFKDEPFDSGNLLRGAESGAPLLAVIVIQAVNSLFGLVAHAATVVAALGVLRPPRKGLARSLDPAFTHLGTLLAFLAGMVALSFTLVGVLLLPRLALAPTVAVVEGAPAGRSVGRSWTLMRGQVLRFLGAIILVVIAFLLAAMVVILPASILAALLPDSPSRGVEIGVDAGATIVGGFLSVPFVGLGSAVIALFYLHLTTGNDVRTAA